MKFIAQIVFFISAFLVSGVLRAQEKEVQVIKIDTAFNNQTYVVVQNIIIDGNKITKDQIITRELSFKPGDSINRKQLDEVIQMNRLRLVNLPLFAMVNITAIPKGIDQLDILIQVKERWYWMPEVWLKLADRNFNVWWNEQNRSLRRINLGGTIKHQNLFGNMEQLGASLQIGYTQKIGLQYAKPYIDVKQRHGVGGKIEYGRSQEMPFMTNHNRLDFARHGLLYVNKTWSAEMYYTFRPKYSTRHLAQLAYRFYSVIDTIGNLNPVYFLNGSDRLEFYEFSYKAEINRTDNWNYSLKGEKIILQAVQRIGTKGMKYQTQLETEAMFLREVKPKLFTSIVFRGRVSFPQLQPYPLVNALGYDTKYLRGYEYYVIDGSHYGVGRLAMKYQLWKHTFKHIPVRYLPEIPVRIYPKIYTDLGYAYNKYPGNSSLNNKWLRSAGIGVDIVTAYDIKIKLEYSLNHLGEHGFFFHQNGD